MDEMINQLACQYTENFSSPEDSLLQDVHQYTLQHHPQAHMLSGKVQGQLLSILSHLLQPRRILEIGTFTGYSALCLAKGLIADGQLHTIELREQDAATARDFFNKSLNKEKIVLHVGIKQKLIQ